MIIVASIIGNLAIHEKEMYLSARVEWCWITDRLD